MDESSKYIIITEGPYDKELLELVLPDDIKSFSDISSSMGYGSAISKAKSLAIRINKNIVLVLDSDTDSEFETEEKKEQIEFIFKSLGKLNQVKTFLFRPEIEVIFLESTNIRKTLDRQFKNLNISNTTHLRKIRRSILKILSKKDISTLRRETSLKELIELCRSLIKKVGDRIQVDIPDASQIDAKAFSKTPLSIGGTIIQDLGNNWLVRLDISIAGKQYEVPIAK